MRKPIEMVTAVAVTHPEISLGEYFRDYEPARLQNDICAKCNKCGTGKCEWDKRAAPVPGWIADIEHEPDNPDKIKSALIYYCPKYQSEADYGRIMPLDEEACFNLLCAIAEQNGAGYRQLLRKFVQLRNDMKGLDERSFLWAKKASEYWQMLYEKRQYEDLLESHYRSMQMAMNYQEDPEFDNVVRQSVAKRGKGKTYDE